MSPSACSRLERNETKVPLEDLPKISECFKIPVQELLPEIFTVNNNPSGNSNGIILSQTVTNNYYNTTETYKVLEIKIQNVEKELEAMRKSSSKSLFLLYHKVNMSSEQSFRLFTLHKQILQK